MGDNDFPSLLYRPEEDKDGFEKLPYEPSKEPGVEFLRQFVRGASDYSQESGGPLLNQTLISSTPSFDLRYPKMPGVGTEQQSIEGLPNATPELLRRFVERKMKNPGGQSLPGFLKGA
jgi:hypothetical protein